MIIGGKLGDTVKACHGSFNIASVYITGWQIAPHYPVPALQDNADTATAWVLLSCIEKWEDQMLWDFPDIELNADWYKPRASRFNPA